MGLFDTLQSERQDPETPPVSSTRAAAAVLASVDAFPVAKRSEILEKTPWGVELLQAARRPPEFTAERQAAFLELLCEVPNISLAALRVGVMRSQVDALRITDPNFAEAMAMARAVAGGMAEAEAFRRGLQGVPRNVFYKGSLIDVEQVYSDGLLGKVLESNVPGYEKKTSVDATVRYQFDWIDLVSQVRESSEDPDPA